MCACIPLNARLAFLQAEEHTLLLVWLFDMLLHSNAHRFIDTENRGWLDVNGVRDGFSAMGVQLSEDVAMQIISKHGSEKFDYAEHAPKLLSVGMVFV